MCFDPVSGTLALLGGGLQAAGSIMGGRGSARAARMQAWMAQQNAQNSLQRGAFEQARLRDQVDTVLDNQTASVAARDLDPAYGSPLVMQGLSAMQGEADAMLVGAGAQQEAAEHLWTAAGKIGQAKDAQRAGWLGAGTAILGTATKWASLASGGYAGAGKASGGQINPDVHANPFGRY